MKLIEILVYLYMRQQRLDELGAFVLMCLIQEEQ